MRSTIKTKYFVAVYLLQLYNTIVIELFLDMVDNQTTTLSPN